MDFSKEISKPDDDITSDEIVEEVPAVDAVINVLITSDKLQAAIRIEPPENNGKDATYQELLDALSGRGVTTNIDYDSLKELSEKPAYNSNVVVARGVAPVNGTDGTATFHINTKAKDLKPKENEDGTVDYRELGLVENVAKGQVLCDITLPTEGTPGVSIEGRELRQRRGRPVPNYMGANTIYNEDKTAILSKIEGQVEFKAQKIIVNEVFYVRGNVDNSTGNIKVSSNVVVQGMVSSGFTVEAGGNIEVKGTVENATIKAGGSVKLLSGITGSQLNCAGDLNCQFIENCNVFVKGDINAAYIINSIVKCGKSIQVSGRMARIIGGSCMAGQNIKAHSIGSAANVETRLELGADPAFIERQQELVRMIPELEKQIEGLKPLLNILTQLEKSNRLTDEKRETYNKVVYSHRTCVKQLEDAKNELDVITERIRKRGFGRVISTGIIYIGTKLAIGSESYTVTDRLTNASLYFNEETHAISIGSAR